MSGATARIRKAHATRDLEDDTIIHQAMNVKSMYTGNIESLPVHFSHSLALSCGGLELEKYNLSQNPALLCRRLFGSNDQRIEGRYEDACFSTCQLRLELGIRPDEQSIQLSLPIQLYPANSSQDKQHLLHSYVQRNRAASTSHSYQRLRSQQANNKVTSGGRLRSVLLEYSAEPALLTEAPAIRSAIH